MKNIKRLTSAELQELYGGGLIDRVVDALIDWVVDKIPDGTPQL